MKVASGELRIALQPLEVHGPNDFEPALSAIKREHASALSVLGNAVTTIYRGRIVDFPAKSRLPAMYGDRRPIPRLPFSRLCRGSVYLPPCRESLHILLRLRRPKAMPRETMSSFSFYLHGGDQRGHHGGFLLSVPVIAELEPVTRDLMSTVHFTFSFLHTS